MGFKKLKVVLTSLWLGFCFVVCGLAQAQAAPDKSPRKTRDPKAMQEEMEKMRQGMEQHQLQMLEQMKERNPALYEQQKAQHERQEAISSIRQDYQNKKIDYAAAQKMLYPLVESGVDEELSRIDQRISRAKSALKELEEMKANPDMMIKKRIEQLLGKGKLDLKSMPDLASSLVP